MRLNPKWIDGLRDFLVLIGTATVSCGAGWLGVKFLSFFNKPPLAPKPPNSGISCPLENPSKTETSSEEASYRIIRAKYISEEEDFELTVVDWKQHKKFLDRKMKRIITQIKNEGKIKGRGKTDLSPPSTSVSLEARSETTDGIIELQAESEPDLTGILKSRKERIAIIKDLIEVRENMIQRSINTTKAQEKEFSKMRTRGVTEQEIESNPDFRCLAFENDYRTTQKASIAALWEEQRELEESLPELQEKILLNRITPCPIRFYERQKRRDLQQLRATSSSQNPRRIPLRNRTESPSPYDSEIPRIGD